LGARQASQAPAYDRGLVILNLQIALTIAKIFDDVQWFGVLDEDSVAALQTFHATRYLHRHA